MSEKFKVGDLVVRTGDSNEGIVRGGIYEVDEITKYGTLSLKGYGYSGFSAERFELHQPIYHMDSNLSKSPAQFLTPPIMSMNYFHTAVLIKCDTSVLSAHTEYEELEPYAVRVAKDSSDMRDTLVRELKKGVATSDCKFLITPIF